MTNMEKIWNDLCTEYSNIVAIIIKTGRRLPHNGRRPKLFFSQHQFTMWQNGQQFDVRISKEEIRLGFFFSQYQAWI